MKHTLLCWVERMWCVCEAYVQRKWKHMWAVCETYVKHMRSTCDILTYFGTGLRCVYVLLSLYVMRIHTFFYVGGKIRPYFVQITQNKALSLERTYRKHKQNANENANTCCNVCVCTCVYGLCFIYVGRKIRPYFRQIWPDFIPYAKETQTET